MGQFKEIALKNSSSTRYYNSEIMIDNCHKWIFRGEEITLKKILDFFKSNLHEDEQGVYISNQYGKFSEVGYLECMGCPLCLDDYLQTEQNILFHTDSGEQLDFQNLYFWTNKEQQVFATRGEKSKIKYRFNRKTLSFISELMVECGPIIKIEAVGLAKEIQPYPYQSTIDVPQQYRSIMGKSG